MLYIYRPTDHHCSMTPQLNMCALLPCSTPWESLLLSVTSGSLWKTMRRWEAEESYQETFFSLAWGVQL